MHVFPMLNHFLPQLKDGIVADAGQCWPLAPDGGPNGNHPPHNFALYFKEGGVGTFLPLYFRFLQYHRALQARQQSGTQPVSRPPPSAPAMSLSQA